MIKKTIVIAALAAAAGWGVFSWQTKRITALGTEAAAQVVEHYPYVTKRIEVADGATYGILMEQADVGGSTANAIFAAAEGAYDLSKVRVGRTIDLIYARDTHELLGLTYQIDSEDVLNVVRSGEDPLGWEASRDAIPYEVREQDAHGSVSSSLFEAGLAISLDERAIIALADVFQWTIDFAMDVRAGDSFAFIYEERLLKGTYVMPGEVLAAKYVNAGTVFYAFRFEDSEGKVGWYDEDGDSVQKVFLKAPVAFKYISSGFTSGMRYVSAFNTATRHRAIDYAASTGTPIRTVGDGTVTFAGWSSAGYGYLTSVRHNATYSTNYAHQSKILVRTGQRVSQGQTIGLVGSTGFSTGPHLHYEMVKNGVKINPLFEEFPSTGPVPDGDRERFEAMFPLLKERLDGMGR